MRIRVAADDPDTMHRYDALLQRLDHAHRLGRRAAQEARMRTALGTPRLRRHVAVLRACLERHTRDVEGRGRLAERLARLETRLRQREARIRHRSLHHPPPPGGADAAALFRLSDALRWMRRSTNHAQRILHYAAAARR